MHTARGDSLHNIIAGERISDEALVACACGLIGIAQQFPEDRRLTTDLKISQRKTLAQQGGIDAPPHDPGPFPEPAKQERHPVLREWSPRLREEEVIRASTSLFYMRLRPIVGSIQIRYQEDDRCELCGGEFVT